MTNKMMIPYEDVVKLVEMVTLFHVYDDNGNDEKRNDICVDLVGFDVEYPGLIDDVIGMVGLDYVEECAKKSMREI